MLYIQTNKEITLTQKIIAAIIVIAILAASVFLFITFLPLIILLLLFAAYKIRKTMKQMREARDKMYEEQMNYNQQEKVVNENSYCDSNSSSQSSQKSDVIYDISPKDYSVEDKK